MNGLNIIDIYKSFGKMQALAGVSFDVPQGEIVAILGPSGSGKSTLLGIVAGLEPPDRGDIRWSGESLASVPPHQRGFGLMFQDFALFPHRNVFDNVAFALQMAHRPKDEIDQRVAEVLSLVGLPGFEKRDVNTLSGGEQQRVALARSLAPHPRLLMLDEPLGSLDRALRERLVVDLRRILRSSQQTALYVTHDQEEAFTLADRVVVMNAGRIEQEGSPQDIYRHPASQFIARFLGMTNLFPGVVLVQDGQVSIRTSLGNFPAPQSDQNSRLSNGQEVTVLLRPDEVNLSGEGSCTLEGVVQEASFRGSTCRAVISVNDLLLRFDLPSTVKVPHTGERVKIGFDPDPALRVFRS